VQRFLHNELARLGEMSEPIRLNSLLLPKFDGWAIILPLCSTVCPSCASAPFAPVPESMTIPLSKAECASPETKRISPSVTTSVGDQALLANSVRVLATDAVRAAVSGSP
jgi:hypothetical protein